MDDNSLMITVKLTRAELLTRAQRERDNLPDTGLVVLEYTLSKKAIEEEYNTIMKAIVAGESDAGLALYETYIMKTTRSACELMRKS